MLLYLTTSSTLKRERNNRENGTCSASAQFEPFWRTTMISLLSAQFTEAIKLATCLPCTGEKSTMPYVITFLAIGVLLFALMLYLKFRNRR